MEITFEAPRCRVVVGANLLSKIEVHEPVLMYDSNIPEYLVAPIKQRAKCIFALPGGEEIKTQKMREKLENFLVEEECGSNSTIVAVGGGSTLDLVGYVASTFCRGVSLIFIPTTLLAMVDAAIGGKNAINIGGFKNMSGTIYWPKNVYIDVEFLAKLPFFALQNGLIEMIKHIILENSTDYHKTIDAILKRDLQITKEAIHSSILTKKKFIENGIESRHVLNFGHTIGHAIEALENFSITHGQAVAMGMMAEARLSPLQDADIKHIDTLITRTELPLHLSRKYSLADWQRAFMYDKKVRDKKPHFVLLEEIGKPLIQDGKTRHEVSQQKLETVIHWLQEQFT